MDGLQIDRKKDRVFLCTSRIIPLHPVTAIQFSLGDYTSWFSVHMVRADLAIPLTSGSILASENTDSVLEWGAGMS